MNNDDALVGLADLMSTKDDRLQKFCSAAQEKMTTFSNEMAKVTSDGIVKTDGGQRKLGDGTTIQVMKYGDKFQDTVKYNVSIEVTEKEFETLREHQWGAGPSDTNPSTWSKGAAGVWARTICDRFQDKAADGEKPLAVQEVGHYEKSIEEMFGLHKGALEVNEHYREHWKDGKFHARVANMEFKLQDAAGRADRARILNVHVVCPTAEGRTPDVDKVRARLEEKAVKHAKPAAASYRKPASPPYGKASYGKPSGPSGKAPGPRKKW